MTLHIIYDHRCPKCGAYYIPYDENVPCPNCGIVEDERFDYIPNAVESILFNLKAYGSYIPPVWSTGSLGDNTLSILFDILEQFRKSKEMDFDTFVKGILPKMGWGDQKYFGKHVYSIAVRIHEEIKKRENVNNV